MLERLHHITAVKCHIQLTLLTPRKSFAQNIPFSGTCLKLDRARHCRPRMMVGGNLFSILGVGGPEVFCRPKRIPPGSRRTRAFGLESIRVTSSIDRNRN